MEADQRPERLHDYVERNSPFEQIQIRSTKSNPFMELETPSPLPRDRLPIEAYTNRFDNRHGWYKFHIHGE
jgi:hypothetical protein